MSSSDSDLEEENWQEEVLALNELPQNQQCADCSCPQAKWASVNLGVFLCSNCSGVHRSLGSHISKIRSPQLDTWDETHLVRLRQVGNAKAKQYWECNILPFEKPNANDAYLVRHGFIKDKYVNKRFIPEEGSGQPKDGSQKPSATRSFNVNVLDKKGWLTKQGARRRNWKKRWFVLHENTLVYYANQGDSYPKGTIKIAPDTTVACVNDDQTKKENGFELQTKNRTYKLLTDSTDDVYPWVYALRAAVHFAQLKAIGSGKGKKRDRLTMSTKKSGSLRKCGGHRRNAVKRRYFVLYGSELAYYKSDRDAEPLKVIVLRGASVDGRVDSATAKKWPLCFNVHTPHRQYTLIPDNKEERREWIDAISSVCQTASASSFVQANADELEKALQTEELIPLKSEDSSGTSSSSSKQKKSDSSQPRRSRRPSFMKKFRMGNLSGKFESSSEAPDISPPIRSSQRLDTEDNQKDSNEIEDIISSENTNDDNDNNNKQKLESTPSISVTPSDESNNNNNNNNNNNTENNNNNGNKSQGSVSSKGTITTNRSSDESLSEFSEDDDEEEAIEAEFVDDSEVRRVESSDSVSETDDAHVEEFELVNPPAKVVSSSASSSPRKQTDSDSGDNDGSSNAGTINSFRDLHEHINAEFSKLGISMQA